jgi:hypothetical protein
MPGLQEEDDQEEGEVDFMVSDDDESAPTPEYFSPGGGARGRLPLDRGKIYLFFRQPTDTTPFGALLYIQEGWALEVELNEGVATQHLDTRSNYEPFSVHIPDPNLGERWPGDRPGRIDYDAPSQRWLFHPPEPIEFPGPYYIDATRSFNNNAHFAIITPWHY